MYETSSISPHLRYAAATDEDGRVLFLFSRFADRCGTPYTSDGKIIWTGEGLPGERGQPYRSFDRLAGESLPPLGGPN